MSGGRGEDLLAFLLQMTAFAARLDAGFERHAVGVRAGCVTPGMAQRAAAAAVAARQDTDAYIRQAAGRTSAQEIADAKALLDAGTITAAEYETLKAKALS